MEKGAKIKIGNGRAGYALTTIQNNTVTIFQEQRNNDTGNVED
jgi:hypothetical protein